MTVEKQIKEYIAAQPEQKRNRGFLAALSGTF
jgi:hypothetical protein